MNGSLTNPDHLKSLVDMCTPDPRSDNQSVLDIFQSGAIAVNEHHAKVANIVIGKCKLTQVGR